MAALVQLDALLGGGVWRALAGGPGLPRGVARAAPRPGGEDEPGCDGYFHTDDSLAAFLARAPAGPRRRAKPSDAQLASRELCYATLNVSHINEAGGAGACVCSGSMLWVDPLALFGPPLGDAAPAGDRAAPQGSGVSCARLCRGRWAARRCGARGRPRGAAPAPAPPGARAARAAPPALTAQWAAFEDAFRTSGGLDVVRPPGPRDFGAAPEADWVSRGCDGRPPTRMSLVACSSPPSRPPRERMAASDVDNARSQWTAFVAATPPYPPDVFSGRGVVMTGGGPKYFIPVFVSLRMLRATGCALPAEVWFFESQLPTGEAAAQLAALGAALRSVDEIRPGASAEVFRNGERGFGYVMKAAILLFSSFREVLYLDSDNVPLTDPADLFAAPGYAATGMLLWPDYWPPSFAPDLARIAPEALPPNATVESGQMVLDKAVVWRALQLALFLNCQGSLYYNLLTNYLGKGDKETFPFAMRMLRLPYASVGDAHPVGSAGEVGPPRSAGGAPTLLSTTMVHYHPVTGRPLLFHSNLNKWGLNVPSSWATYARRWAVVTPPGWRFSAHAGEDPPLLPLPAALAAAGVARDPEREAWAALAGMRCAPWVEEYMAQQGDAPSVERAFAFFRDPYDTMRLDEHITGRYIHEEAPPPPPGAGSTDGRTPAAAVGLDAAAKSTLTMLPDLT